MCVNHAFLQTLYPQQPKCYCPFPPSFLPSLFFVSFSIVAIDRDSRHCTCLSCIFIHQTHRYSDGADAVIALFMRVKPLRVSMNILSVGD